MTKLHLRYDADFLATAFQRYRRQKMSPLWGIALRSIAAGIGMLGAGCFFWLGEVTYGLGSLLFVVLVALAPFLERRFERWRLHGALKKSPYGNEDLTMACSDDGFHVTSTKQDVKLQWDVFTRVAHFRDGFLLLQGPVIFNWIPFSALDAAGVKSLEALLRAKIKEHKVVEQVALPDS